MLRPGFLKKRFQAYVENYRQEKEIRQAGMTLYRAVRDEHTKLEDIARAAEKITGILPDDIIDDILLAALSRDDADIFNLVLDKLKNGDATASLTARHSSAMELSLSFSRKSLLYAAIEQNAENIALMLANNPRVDPSISGHASTRWYGHGYMLADETQYKTPIAFASEKGMLTVLKALEKRSAIQVKQDISPR